MCGGTVLFCTKERSRRLHSQTKVQERQGKELTELLRKQWITEKKESWEAWAKEIKDPFEKDKTPKRMESRSQRDKQGRIEENLNLKRRMQREKDLQKTEARTPPSQHHSSNSSVQTVLMRSVSRHVQLALSLPSALNDHYSPVKAADYIEQRLRPAIAYYRRRVPVNTLFRITMKVLLLTAAVASSVLAKYEYKQLVTIATAFASLITAYSEFADAGRKVERCVHTYRRH